MMTYMLPKSLSYHSHLSSRCTFGVNQNPANESASGEPAHSIAVPSHRSSARAPSPCFRLAFHLGERAGSQWSPRIPRRGLHWRLSSPSHVPRSVFTRHPGSRPGISSTTTRTRTGTGTGTDYLLSSVFVVLQPSSPSLSLPHIPYVEAFDFV